MEKSTETRSLRQGYNYSTTVRLSILCGVQILVEHNSFQLE